jgi:hypothetical protein
MVLCRIGVCVLVLLQQVLAGSDASIWNIYPDGKDVIVRFSLLSPSFVRIHDVKHIPRFQLRMSYLGRLRLAFIVNCTSDSDEIRLRGHQRRLLDTELFTIHTDSDQAAADSQLCEVLTSCVTFLREPVSSVDVVLRVYPLNGFLGLPEDVLHFIVFALMALVFAVCCVAPAMYRYMLQLEKQHV